MRWLSENKWDSVNIGDTRTITKFLLFPKCINDEWRWLEKATYSQICIKQMGYASMDYNMYKTWVNDEWVNK